MNIIENAFSKKLFLSFEFFPPSDHIISVKHQNVTEYEKKIGRIFERNCHSTVARPRGGAEVAEGDTAERDRMRRDGLKQRSKCEV